MMNHDLSEAANHPAHDPTGAGLLGRRTFEDYVCLAGGKVSRLLLGLCYEHGDPGREDSGLSEVGLKLRADLHRPFAGTICPTALVKSATGSGKFSIFTCDCGEPLCAGIVRDVLVVPQGSLTLWKAYHATGRRIYLFDREQYRSEILTRCREGVQWVKAGEGRVFAPFQNIARLEKLLAEAGA